MAQINCVNLDAHPDYGVTEGRHSGNAFRYAEEDGYLGKYCIIGVHENNISQGILMDMHKTIFAKTVLLSCDTPEMAIEISAQSKLAPLIIGQIGPRTLVVKPDGESTIRKWLEKKNWVPRPGMVTGDGLHKWLNKK